MTFSYELGRPSLHFVRNHPAKLPGKRPVFESADAHARRQFFELADIAANARRGKKGAAISPIALEAVKRIDALFD
jgi:transposase